MFLGTGKQCITPEHKVRLCGFTTRKTPFDSVQEDIFVRVHLFNQGDKQLLFIYGDLLWWQYSFVEKAKEQIKENFNIECDKIIFTASHNHGGPATGNEFSELLEKADDEYTNYLLKKVLQAVKEATNNAEQVVCKRFDDNIKLNVYRRKKVNNEIQMQPNYDVDVDTRLTLFKFETTAGGCKAIGVHYACHANICAENIVHPDYPGVLLKALEEKHDDCIGFFWQGCTADMRPNCVIGEQFQRQSFEGVKFFESQLSQKCEEMLLCKGEEISFCDLEINTIKVDLPLEGYCDLKNAKKQLEQETDITTIAWLKSIIQQGCDESRPLLISRVSIANELVCYTFSAEVSQYYARFARELEEKSLCIAYSNGMVGYVCTQEQIENGGYEPKESGLFFALAGTFAPTIEKKIKNAMKLLKNM